MSGESSLPFLELNPLAMAQGPVPPRREGTEVMKFVNGECLGRWSRAAQQAEATRTPGSQHRGAATFSTHGGEEAAGDAQPFLPRRAA